jgi:hypothetical protein
MLFQQSQRLITQNAAWGLSAGNAFFLCIVLHFFYLHTLSKFNKIKTRWNLMILVWDFTSKSEYLQMKIINSCGKEIPIF